jgi:sigma-B regulation protein RsbU (phosphoserine phosphatase)
MDPKKIRRLKYEMGGANFLANLVAAVFVQSFASRLGPPVPNAYWAHPLIEALDIAFTPVAFITIIAMTIAYERPIHRFLEALADGRPIAPELAAAARQRLLNEPFLTMAADLGIWLAAAVIWGLAWRLVEAPGHVFYQTIFNCVSIGMITITLVFFLQEHILQKHLAPLFFPAGGLSQVPKTLKIRIRTRLAALLLVTNLIPLVSVLALFYRTTGVVQEPRQALDFLEVSIGAYGLIFIAAGVFLTGLVSRNLTIPFFEIISTLRSVRNGRFDQKVRVTTSDEIGYTGDVINEMTAGLQERERMRQALDLAMEVQQSLLPKSAPRVAGLDIAGASFYCEETGGDYFDYIDVGGAPAGAVSVAVGDVSDHGIPSAMLMTTIRAFLRQRAAASGGLARILGDVNRELCRDVEDSGHFVTLFLATLDRPGLRLHWASAGHEPAALFDPRTDAFRDLGRTGLPLGVDPESAYTERETGVAPGQIVVIGTDGIWESQDDRGEMFGKRRFQDLIRANGRATAREILDRVVAAVDGFTRPRPRTDDLTLVVIKVLD